MSFVGASGPRPTSNTGTLVLNLKPHDRAPGEARRDHQRLRPKLAAVPGIRVFLQNPPPIRIGGQLTSAQYQYTLQAPTSRALSLERHPARSLAQLPGFVDVNTNLKNQSPVIALDIDRDKLAPLGLSIGQVEDALQSAFSSRQISTIYAATSQYQVILEVAPELQADPATLAKIHVRASSGKLVPVDTVARISRSTQALTVNHQGQLPVGDALLQPAARRFTGRRRRSHPQDGARDEHAGLAHHQPAGHGAGLRGLAARARHPAAGRRSWSSTSCSASSTRASCIR
jgi:HAE1 family hydrophobic/amphiphilic exporter-1